MFIVFLNRDSVQIMLDLYLSIPIWVLLKWYYFSYFKFQLFITTILENKWLLDPETVQWNLEGLTRATYFVLLYEILWEITQIIMLFADKDGFISSFTHCTSLSPPGWRLNLGPPACWASTPPVSLTPAQAIHFFPGLSLSTVQCQAEVVRRHFLFYFQLSNNTPTQSLSLFGTLSIGSSLSPFHRCSLSRWRSSWLFFVLCSLIVEWELHFIKHIFCTNDILTQIFLLLPTDLGRLQWLIFECWTSLACLE